MEFLANNFWIVTAILGSIIGLAFSTYFETTRMGIWMYAKFDRVVDFLVERWGWTSLKQDDDAWKNLYPSVARKIDELEARLAELENK
jgi:hypothetical protein